MVQMDRDPLRYGNGARVGLIEHSTIDTLNRLTVKQLDEVVRDLAPEVRRRNMRKSDLVQEGLKIAVKASTHNAAATSVSHGGLCFRTIGDTDAVFVLSTGFLWGRGEQHRPNRNIY